VAWWWTVLLRLAYLGVANVFALLRLLPMSNRDKDAEILALRHQLSVLQRQLGPGRVRFTPADRALLAALLHRLPRKVLGSLHLVVRPDTVSHSETRFRGVSWGFAAGLVAWLGSSRGAAVARPN
jgi:hypothetical protein